MHSLEELVRLYGAVIIFAGTFIEGETIVVVGGFLAHQGIIDPYLVAASAFAGSFVGDQFWFYLGRRHAANRMVRRAISRPFFDKVMAKIADHPRKFILTFRFIYGIRIVSPIALGLTDIRVRTFFIYNTTAAAVWAVLFTLLGYAFGKVVESVLGRIKAVEQALLVAGAIALAVFAAYHIGLRIRRRILRKREAAEPSRTGEK